MQYLIKDNVLIGSVVTQPPLLSHHISIRIAKAFYNLLTRLYKAVLEL